MADLGEADVAKKLAASCKYDAEEFEEYDAFGLTKMSILMSYVEMKCGDSEKGLRVLNDIIAKTENKEDLGIGLAYGLLALYHLEKGNPKAAEDTLKEAEKNKLDDANVSGARVLVALASNSLINKDNILELASRSSGANILIKKRVEKRVLSIIGK